MENYRTDLAKLTPLEQVHNLRFADVARMLSGNVLIRPVPKSTHKYQVLAYWHQNYYLTIFALERRSENSLVMFAGNITLTLLMKADTSPPVSNTPKRFSTSTTATRFPTG